MIDYQLLATSITYYADNGYKRVETPWTVTEQVDKITKPVDRISFQLKHNDKCLVASGEQSFLYQYLKGFLPEGKFQTITPCFRFEPFDPLHTKYFMKNELIMTDIVNTNKLVEMLDIAIGFYQPMFKKELQVVTTKEGFDIEVDGKELGSYGIRECEFLKWIYGTGCAEPRTSLLIRNYGVSH